MLAGRLFQILGATTQAGITRRHLATDLLRISLSIREGGNWYSPVGHWTATKPITSTPAQYYFTLH